MVLLASVAALAPAVPASAAPRAGERYDGRTATGQRVFVEVARGGARLSDYVFLVETRCSDGKVRVQGLNARNEPTVRIDSSGAFEKPVRSGRFTYPNAGRPITGTATLIFRGSFDGTGTAASGTVTATFRSKKLRCTAKPTEFRVDVDGSPRAPFRDGSVATGRYAVSGRGLTFTAFRPFLPGRSVDLVQLRFRARCGNGSLTGRRLFEFITIRGSSFAMSGRSNVTAGPGLGFRDRFSIRGRFSRTADGTYRVRGTFRLRGSLVRRGTKVDTCRTGAVGFSGRLRSGPDNLPPG